MANLSEESKETAENLMSILSTKTEGEQSFGDDATNADILTAIYRIMVKKERQKLVQDEIDDDKNDSRNFLSQKRHNEILEVLGFKKEIPRKEEEKIHENKLKKQKNFKLDKVKVPETKSKKIDTPREDVGLSGLSKIGIGLATAGVVGAGVFGAKSGLAKAIMSHESFGGDPNAYNIKVGPQSYKGGKGVTPYGKTISEMTVGEIRQRQSKGELFAVGKWQMVPNTLNDAVSKGFLKDKDVFTNNKQDELFEYFAKYKRPIIGRYLNGDPTVSRDDAILAIAQEWASIGVPRDMQGAHKFLKKGESYYEGDGINHATTSPDYIGAMLDEHKSGTRVTPIEGDTSGPSGAQIDSTSQSNADMNEMLQKQNTMNQINNTTNVVVEQTEPHTNGQKTDDRSIYERKKYTK